MVKPKGVWVSPQIPLYDFAKHMTLRVNSFGCKHAGSKHASSMYHWVALIKLLSFSELLMCKIEN